MTSPRTSTIGDGGARPLVLDGSGTPTQAARHTRRKTTWSGSSPASLGSGFSGEVAHGDGHPPEVQHIFAFADGARFQTTIGIVIFLNIFVLWGETDFPSLPIWDFFDNVFLLIFIAEMTLKVILHRIDYFIGKDMWWHMLDYIVVILGVLDLWVIPLFKKQSGGSGLNMPILRFLRLLRLLRLLRVFKMFKKLMALLNALVLMFRTFVWIFSVLFLFILSNAIVLTHVLGRAEGVHDWAIADQETLEASVATLQVMFKDVSTSMFTLFQVTTADNWDEVATPTIKLHPGWRCFFVFFISFASWTIISILTAVASDSMIAASSDKKHEEQAEQEHRQREFMSFLRAAFQDADEDGNGLLDKDEFEQLISVQEVTDQMRRLGIHLSKEELSKAWDMLDVEETGTLTIDEFVTGLAHLQEGLATKHIVNVDYSLKKVASKIDNQMDSMITQVNAVRTHHDGLMQNAKEQDQLYTKIELPLELWQKWASKNQAILDAERDKL